MSTRPRFGGDGQLRLPVGVAVTLWRGEPTVVGTLRGESVDPFGRARDGLFLAEEFARLALLDGATLAAWTMAHGAVAAHEVVAIDPMQMPPDPVPFSERGWQPSRDPSELTDPLRIIATEQRSVAWQLHSIALLSDGVVDPRLGWDPVWAHPDLEFSGMHATIADPGGARSVRARGADAKTQAWEERSRERIRQSLLGDLGDDPASLVELQRRLMEPYLAFAQDSSVILRWSGAPDGGGGPSSRGRLEVGSRMHWSSVLVPVYLQLLEGLRRVTEGQRGGAFCLECGLPFLVLDARRANFCNDRERYRYGQREHRRRQGLSSGRRRPKAPHA